MSDKPYRPMESPDVGNQRNAGYIWLPSSAFFLIDPILSHSRRLWVESGIIYAIFLALYVSYMRARTTRQRHLLIAGFYLLGLISLPINGGATSFFIYTAAFLPFVVAQAAVFVVILSLLVLGL